MFFRRIHICALSIAMMTMLLSSCKPGVESDTKTLDYLVSGQIVPKDCGTPAETSNDWNITVIGYPGKEAALKARAARALSAAPKFIQNLFNIGLKGKIYVTPKPFDQCPSIEVDRGKEPFACWYYSGKQASSSVSRSNAVSNVSLPAHPVIAMSGDKDGLFIDHSALRALGFLYVSKFVELNLVPGQGLNFSPANYPRFQDDVVELSLQVLRDVSNAKINIQGSLYESLFKGNFLSLPEEQKRTALQLNDAKFLQPWTKFTLFADSFDSYYCSAKTRGDMDIKFHSSFMAFATFAEQFEALSQRRALVGPQEGLGLTAGNDMLFQMMMLIIMQMFGGGMPIMGNPMMPGLNNGFGGLQTYPNNIGIQPINTYPNTLGNGNLGNNGNMSTGSSTDEVIRLTNEYRRSKGLNPLGSDQSLTAACKFHANWMANGGGMQHYMSNPTYAQSGYATPGAENVAQGQTSPQQVVQTWINSPGHEANMSGNYAVMGAADTNNYWCQQFR